MRITLFGQKYAKFAIHPPIQLPDFLSPAPNGRQLDFYITLKIHSPHSRDFSHELGEWAFLRLRTLFYALMTKKCYPQKMPSGNIFHTDGVTIFGKEAAA